jgi:hypothetical protein
MSNERIGPDGSSGPDGTRDPNAGDPNAGDPNTRDPNRREPSIRGGFRNPRLRDAADGAAQEGTNQPGTESAPKAPEPAPQAADPAPQAPGAPVAGAPVAGAPISAGNPGPGRPEARIDRPAATSSAGTPVIYLDVDDEITSAAARVRRAVGDRLALVLPYGSHVATSRINFRLLAREAKEHGKHIEIVAADPSARALAGAAGLTVHTSVAAFEGREEPPAAGGLDRLAAGGATGGATGEMTVPWAAPGTRARGPAADAEDTATRPFPLLPRDRPKVPIIGRARPAISTRFAVAALSIFALLLLVGGAFAYSSLPSATISISPRSERLGPLSLVVSAQPGIASPDPSGLTIPAQTFTIDVQASQTFPATGIKVSEARATGNVTFSSFDTGNTNRIKAGAVVQTASGVGFKTVADAVMPPAEVTFPDHVVVPSTATVGIEALELGPSGNVAATTISVLPKGENKNLTKVTNSDATTGGTHEEATLVSQADVDGALAALNDALQADFDTKVTEATGVPQGTTLFPETRTLGTATTPSVDPASLVGTEVKEFTLGLTGQGTVLGVDPAPIRGLAEARLRARVPEGWHLLDDSIVIDIDPPIVAGTTVSYPVRARGIQTRMVDEKTLRTAIRGLGIAEARSTLGDYGDVTITLWPDWVTTIPANDSRVTFTIGDPAPLQTPGAAPSGSGEALPTSSLPPAESSASPAAP